MSEALENHLVRNLLVFAAVTGSSFFLGRAVGIHVEDLPSSVVNAAGSVVDLLPAERDYQGRGELYDKPVDPGVRKQFLTEDFGHVEIPVRDEPGQGGQLGITLRTYLVDGEERWGSTYPSNSPVGKTEGPDGEYYGLWFKADSVPLFERTESGEYVPVGVAVDAYMAENFLTTPLD